MGGGGRQARADVANAEQGVSRAYAEWTYSNNNLHRIEPLLIKQFVTVDQVDRARTSEIAQAQSLKQAESQLRLAQAGCSPPGPRGTLQARCNKQGPARTGAECRDTPNRWSTSAALELRL